MINGKERSFLKGLANKIEPIITIGKGGITDNVLTQIDEALESRELIKGKVLDNNDLDAKEVCNFIAKELNAQYVQSIGSTFVLFRRKRTDSKIILPK